MVLYRLFDGIKKIMWQELKHIIGSIDWEHFHFLRPKAFYAFLPVAMIALLLILGNRDRKKWKKIVQPLLRPFMFTKKQPAGHPASPPPVRSRLGHRHPGIGRSHLEKEKDTRTKNRGCCADRPRPVAIHAGHRYTT